MNFNKKIIAMTLSAVLAGGVITPAVIYAEEAPSAVEQSADVADSNVREWENGHPYVARDRGQAHGAEGDDPCTMG